MLQLGRGEKELWAGVGDGGGGGRETSIITQNSCHLLNSMVAYMVCCVCFRTWQQKRPTTTLISVLRKRCVTALLLMYVPVALQKRAKHVVCLAEGPVTRGTPVHCLDKNSPALDYQFKTKQKIHFGVLSLLGCSFLYVQWTLHRNWAFRQIPLEWSQNPGSKVLSFPFLTGVWICVCRKGGVRMQFLRVADSHKPSFPWHFSFF